MDPLRFAIQRLHCDWLAQPAALQAAASDPTVFRSGLRGAPVVRSRGRSAGSGVHLAAIATQEDRPGEQADERLLGRRVLPGAALPGLLLEAITRLRDAGLPLDRLSLALVPEQRGFHGSQHQWNVDEPERLRSFLRLYEFFQGQDHRTSVLHHVCCTGRLQRLKLQELAVEAIPFPLLQDLRRAHFHDYLALPLPPGGSHRVVLTLATRRRQGFAAEDLLLLRRLLPALRQLLRCTDHFGLGRWENVDPLTSVGSRHRLLHDLAAAQAAVGRGGGSDALLSLLLLDLEDFGAYNKVFGSFAADDALQAVAQRLQSRWGSGAIGLARIGSDSFALLLRGVRGAALCRLAEQVQAAIEDLRYAHPSSREPFLTASLAGISLPSAPDGEAMPPLEQARRVLALAEEALALAREAPGPQIRVH